MNSKSKRASEWDFERLVSDSATSDLPASEPQIAAAAPPFLTSVPVIAPVSAGTTPSESAESNPTVSAGMVRWHADFATACLAAGKSGKPIFLFQMMGRLDQKFC
ncbi:MAG TPA: hypothetical protein V6C69_09920 [Trichormus sp.]|jgi:hypothetical protein